MVYIFDQSANSSILLTFDSGKDVAQSSLMRPEKTLIKVNSLNMSHVNKSKRREELKLMVFWCAKIKNNVNVMDSMLNVGFLAKNQEINF